MNKICSSCFISRSGNKSGDQGNFDAKIQLLFIISINKKAGRAVSLFFKDEHGMKYLCFK
jgi:hypothetical protein